MSCCRKQSMRVVNRARFLPCSLRAFFFFFMFCVKLCLILCRQFSIHFPDPLRHHAYPFPAPNITFPIQTLPVPALYKQSSVHIITLTLSLLQTSPFPSKLSLFLPCAISRLHIPSSRRCITEAETHLKYTRTLNTMQMSAEVMKKTTRVAAPHPYVLSSL